jgi:hypothetical protein
MTGIEGRGDPREYDQKAIWLETFVASYTPSGWREPIGSVMPKFMFTAEEAFEMERAFAMGTLEEELKTKYDNRPVVVMAIMEFFEKQSPAYKPK